MFDNMYMVWTHTSEGYSPSRFLGVYQGSIPDIVFTVAEEAMDVLVIKPFELSAITPPTAERVEGVHVIVPKPHDFAQQRDDDYYRAISGRHENTYDFILRTEAQKELQVRNLLQDLTQAEQDVLREHFRNER